MFLDVCVDTEVSFYLSWEFLSFEQRHMEVNDNGYDRKNEPTIFLPSGVQNKPKPKTNPKTN